MADDQYIGYLKYSGHSVNDGCLDARKAANALIGFDESLRFFIEDDFPELKGKSFEIPVKIQAGSWEAFIPSTIAEWVGTAFGISGAAYLAAAASQIAQNDFKDKRIVDIFRDALRMLQWVVRLGIHLKGLSVKEIKGIRWKKDNTIALIPDGKGEFIEVPTEILEKYIKTPPKILSKMAKLIEKGLASEVFVKGEKNFKAVNPARLLDIIKEKEEQVKKVLPEMLRKLGSKQEKEEAYLYRGVEGFKNYLQDILLTKETVYFIGAKAFWLDSRLKHFLPRFQRERKRLGIKFMHLFDEEVKEQRPEILKLVGKPYRFLPKKYSSPTAIDIFGDYVVTINVHDTYIFD